MSSSDAYRILALAPNAWEGQWMNRQHILARLARIHRVLYSTGPLTVWDRGTPSFRAAGLRGGLVERDGVLIDQPPRWLLSWPSRPGWDRLVTSRVTRRWRRELNRLGRGPVIAYLFYPTFLRYAEGLGADRVVYHPYDLFSRTPGWTTADASDESRLLQLCDVAITSSEPTRLALQALTDRPVYCVPNGVDANLFMAGQGQPVPPDLDAIPRPRFGYVGTINRKVDLPLIATLASREPGWHFVLVGEIFGHDAVTGPALEDCQRLPNVHFLPRRPKEQLPALMAGLDAGLMCYRAGTWMDAAYPLKLHEYLASGLPIVSSELPAIQHYRTLIDMATGAEAWQAAIRRVLAGEAHGSRSARQAEALRNTWDHRVARINDLLATTLARPAARIPQPA